MEATSRTGAAWIGGVLACPDPSCHEAFRCEACLNEHLKARHAVRYSDVCGQVPEAWAEFCPTHAAYTTPML